MRDRKLRKLAVTCKDCNKCGFPSVLLVLCPVSHEPGSCYCICHAWCRCPGISTQGSLRQMQILFSARYTVHLRTACRVRLGNGRVMHRTTL